MREIEKFDGYESPIIQLNHKTKIPKTNKNLEGKKKPFLWGVVENNEVKLGALLIPNFRVSFDNNGLM